MKSRSKKEEELKELKEKLHRSKITVFTSFSTIGEKGLSVVQMQELKNGLRDLNSEYLVTKKTLFDIALRDLKKKGVDVLNMEGSVGIILGGDDSYAVSKKAYEFSRKNKSLKFFGALLEEGYIDQDKFLEMAKMPSREVLIGKLLGMIKYPIMGLTVVLSEIAKGKSQTQPQT
jgi:large subunit ribosomal protein L10